MSKLFARFLKEESGATAIEYGLIAALIALAIIVGAQSLGNSLNNQFDHVSSCVSDPSSCAGGGADAGDGGG